MSIVTCINFNDDDASDPKDFSANGNGAISTTDLSIVNGETGKAGDFNGSSSKALLPYPSSLETSSLGIFVKFKVDSTTGSDQYITQSGNNWFLIYDHSAGDLKAELSTSNKTVTLSTNISTGTWYYCTLSYDGSTAKLFLGTTQKASKSLTGSFSSGSYIYLGYKGTTDQNFFDGKIEDFRVYTQNLSDANITALNDADAGMVHTVNRKHAFKTGDILRADPDGDDLRGVVTWKVSDTEYRFIPTSGSYNPAKKLHRVGNIFDTARQDYIEIDAGGIKIRDGVATDADIGASDKINFEADKNGLNSPSQTLNFGGAMLTTGDHLGANAEANIAMGASGEKTKAAAIKGSRVKITWFHKGDLSGGNTSDMELFHGNSSTVFTGSGASTDVFSKKIDIADGDIIEVKYKSNSGNAPDSSIVSVVIS